MKYLKAYLSTFYKNFKRKHFKRMKGGIIPWRRNEPIKFYFMAKKNSAYHKQLIDFINKRMNYFCYLHSHMGEALWIF